MSDLTRRGFGMLSLGSLAAIGAPGQASADAACTATGTPALLPNQLAINCASRQNFKLFRQYSSYMGLVGIVSMVDTRVSSGSYWAGSLYLFPWLKPQAATLRNTALHAELPTGAWSSKAAQPIPGPALPVDDYLCRFLLKAPWQNFIGFGVDTPPSQIDPFSVWSSTIPKLSDGKPVWVNWTSSNLNRGWFGGSNVIPNQGACNGSAWRALIADALNRVSSEKC